MNDEELHPSVHRYMIPKIAAEFARKWAFNSTAADAMAAELAQLFLKYYELPREKGEP